MNALTSVDRLSRTDLLNYLTFEFIFILTTNTNKTTHTQQRRERFDRSKQKLITTEDRSGPIAFFLTNRQVVLRG